jgi:glutaredoxin-related protein
MEKVILYSTHCPRCRVIETKLKQKNIAYDEINDVEVMKTKGFEMAPQLEVGETIMDFKEAVKWIGEQ